MTRRCSHCSNNGHNLRTCPARAGSGGGGGGVGGFKLFGVRLTEGVSLRPTTMKKSASMGNLSTAAAVAAANDDDGGYNSDDPAHGSSRSERKKGTPWTEEEHRLFLLGLHKLGKGDWRGIARNYVASRTPTQVTSHAQKYFIRQTNVRKKRRSSLFDMVPEVPIDEVPAVEEQQLLPRSASGEDHESKPMELLPSSTCNGLFCSFYPAFVPVPPPFWPPTEIAPPSGDIEMGETHEVLKPSPVLPKDPTNMDAAMSRLNIMEPSALTLKLLTASSSRQSAFHINPSTKKDNAIHAVGSILGRARFFI